MSKKIIQIKKRENALQLTWILNNICTNHCDYCVPTLHMGTNHHYEWDHARAFIERLFDRYPSIHCTISGGEPTLSPFFPEMVKMFFDRGHTVGITTNGSRSLRYFEEIAPMLSYICFSYHPSYHDDGFYEKALMASQHCNVTVRVMMDSRHWQRSVDMYNMCINSKTLNTEPVKILAEVSTRTGVGEEYTPEQLDWINNNFLVTVPFSIKNPNWKRANIGAEFYYDDGTFERDGDSVKLVTTGQTDFRGWACNIGLESLFVHWDGRVKKGNCMQGGLLFHVNEHEQHPLPTRAEICYQNLCSCGTDVLISKVPVYDKNDDIVQKNSVYRQVFNQEEYKNAFYDGENRVKEEIIRLMPKNELGIK